MDPRLRSLAAVPGWIAALVLSAAVCVQPSPAQTEKAYEISNHDVTVQVAADGSYDVEESITYDFQQGSFTFAYRRIDPEGGEVRDLTVRSPDAALDSVDVSRDGEYVRVRWTYPERTAPLTVEFTYSVSGALVERGSENEIRWDPLAPEATVDTRDVDLRLLLPATFDLTAEDVRVETDAAVEVSRRTGGWEIHVREEQVEAGDDLPITVRFPTQVAGRYAATPSEIGVAIALGILGIIGGIIANVRLRGPRPAVTAHRPPSDPSLMDAAVLLGRGESTAVLATIFDLARRGHVTLTHVEDADGGWMGGEDRTEIEVHPDPDAVSEPEARVIELLEASDTLEDFWSDTSAERTEMFSQVQNTVEERGWMERHTTRTVFLFLGGIAAFITGMVVVFQTGMVSLLLGIGLVGAGVGAWIPAFRHVVLTDEGARRYAEATDFLHRKKEEIERLRQTSPYGASQEITEWLPWLVLHSKFSASWIESLREDLEASGADIEVPAGLRSRAEAAAPYAAMAAVIVTSQSSAGAGAAGVAGGAAGGAAAGGGAAGAG
jgi:hypothetical protein